MVPVGFHWNGTQLIVCTATNTPKVAALTANPKVALTIDTDTQPPNVLLVRGTATIDVVEGVAPEYLEGAKKGIRALHWPEFEANVRATYEQMARITIIPEWAKLMDFKTRFPSFLHKLAKEARSGK
ncbi:MAG: pyridoxamine 5'-phosphate oxidase family protein [Pseudonocardiaceae bacterium]